MDIKLIKLNKQNFEEKVVDKNYFRILYIPELHIYVMACTVFWVALYERFYAISEEDYNTYKINKEEFYKKFKNEISQNSKVCFSERFIGSEALRDYDGRNGFQQTFPVSGASNPFNGYVYIDGIFYARIVWEHDEIYVPPVQAILQEDESYKYPLRENCELQYHPSGEAICYKFKILNEENNND